MIRRSTSHVRPKAKRSNNCVSWDARARTVICCHHVLADWKVANIDVLIAVPRVFWSIQCNFVARAIVAVLELHVTKPGGIIWVATTVRMPAHQASAFMR
jgi:hypothetical protein